MQLPKINAGSHIVASIFLFKGRKKKIESAEILRFSKFLSENTMMDFNNVVDCVRGERSTEGYTGRNTYSLHFSELQQQK